MKWERIHSRRAGGGGWKVDISTVCGGVVSLSYKSGRLDDFAGCVYGRNCLRGGGPARPGPAALEMTDKLR